jgi:hypothetical protein
LGTSVALLFLFGDGVTLVDEDDLDCVGVVAIPCDNSSCEELLVFDISVEVVGVSVGVGDNEGVVEDNERVNV